MLCLQTVSVVAWGWGGGGVESSTSNDKCEKKKKKRRRRKKKRKKEEIQVTIAAISNMSKTEIQVTIATISNMSLVHDDHNVILSHVRVYTDITQMVIFEVSRVHHSTQAHALQ